MSASPGEAVLPNNPADIRHSLVQATGADPQTAQNTLRELLRQHPDCLEAWARLSDLCRDDIERYAYARVGYHRGLDAARKSGWKGSGYIRWERRSNRGFLMALDALRYAARRIGETEEEARCAQFLMQLDPAWSGSEDAVRLGDSGEG